MRPYLDEVYQAEQVKNIIQLFDSRSYRFNTMIAFKKMQSELERLKPRQ